MSELNITSKMIKVITGFTLRTSQRILNRVRIEINRTDDQYISLSEFCSLKKIDEDNARKRLIKYGLL